MMLFCGKARGFITVPRAGLPSDWSYEHGLQQRKITIVCGVTESVQGFVCPSASVVSVLAQAVLSWSSGWAEPPAPKA